MIAATGARAGSPGSWLPAGATTPATFADTSGLTAYQADGTTPSAATPWTTGQSVILGDASPAHWSGVGGWVNTVAP